MPDDTALSHDATRRFYDRFGRRQDLQAVYENPALDLLLAHGDFATARRVVEFGCGTGRLARRLLARHLPADAHYLGLDVSATMHRLAGRRLAPWPDRAKVRLTEGAIRLPVDDAGCDRVLATYVLDLLSDADIAAFLVEARRVLTPDGRLCLVALTPGERGLPRLVSSAWARLHRWRPAAVGGCRPIRLGDRLVESGWHLRYHRTVVALGISSEVVIAAPTA